MSLIRLLSAGALMLASAVAGASCAGADRNSAALVADADARRGRDAFRAYGCHGCHTVNGVNGARGRVGPPLNRLAERSYIGGVVPNTPETLVRWIQNPLALSPRTAMPDLRVPPDDARDIAAFLYGIQ